MLAVSHSYWRTIKAGKRTFESIKNEQVRLDVKELARTDVMNGVITVDDYEAYIGEQYEESSSD